jgi:hypothetical protein
MTNLNLDDKFKYYSCILLLVYFGAAGNPRSSYSAAPPRQNPSARTPAGVSSHRRPPARAPPRHARCHLRPPRGRRRTRCAPERAPLPRRRLLLAPVPIVHRFDTSTRPRPVQLIHAHPPATVPPPREQSNNQTLQTRPSRFDRIARPPFLPLHSIKSRRYTRPALPPSEIAPAVNSEKLDFLFAVVARVCPGVTEQSRWHPMGA